MQNSELPESIVSASGEPWVQTRILQLLLAPVFTSHSYTEPQLPTTSHPLPTLPPEHRGWHGAGMQSPTKEHGAILGPCEMQQETKESKDIPGFTTTKKCSNF